MHTNQHIFFDLINYFNFDHLMANPMPGCAGEVDQRGWGGGELEEQGY